MNLVGEWNVFDLEGELDCVVTRNECVVSIEVYARLCMRLLASGDRGEEQ